MKTAAIIGLSVCILMTLMWVLRREDRYIGINVDKMGSVLSRQERLISFPMVSELVVYLGLRSDGAVRLYGEYVPYAIDPRMHSEIKGFITANSHLGFHGGWGCANYGSKGIATRIGIQCGIGSGSIARNWTLENGTLTHYDVTTK